MSTTTQILFNSPALHSLKRDQLIKLCKIHSLKANGKNTELIQRLRFHAQSLPKDSPLSVAARSEADDGPMSSEPMEMDECDQLTRMMEVDEEPLNRHRPSEQWEVVMDSIEEVEENSSQSTLSSQRTINNTASGEFGTRGSAASTVTSSIRALATSLGLKRTLTNPPSNFVSSNEAKAHLPKVDSDDLTKNSKPYSTIPPPASLPQTDHFTLSTGRPSLGATEEPESPLPGHALRPGIPAPPNARLSLGLGIGVPATPTRKTQPTTTIRLVSNPLQECAKDLSSSYDEGGTGTPQLKPFQTAFDITFGSPVQGGMTTSGFGSLTFWPPKGTSPDDGEITTATLSSVSNAFAPSNSLPKTQSLVSPSPPRTLDIPSTNPAPFVFGSPHHKVSNDQFREAAASVLEEMNARLRSEGVDEIGVEIINKLHPTREVVPNPSDGGRKGGGEVGRRFEDVHRREFGRMEGIDWTVRKRQLRREGLLVEAKEKEKEDAVVVGRKRKSSVLEQDSLRSRTQRTSMVANGGRVSTTRVTSNGRQQSNGFVPGGFRLDDEVVADEERGGKRMRRDDRLECVRIQEEEKEREREIQEEKKGEMKSKLEREKEEIRKRLETNRARRSSVAGRKSIGRRSLGKNGPRPSVLVKQKPKPSRFGFLASAKSIVQSVWNRNKTTTTTSNIPKLSSTAAVAVSPPAAPKEEIRPKTVPVPSSFVPSRKAALAPAKPTATTVVASAPLPPPGTLIQGSNTSQAQTQSARRSALPDGSGSAYNSTRDGRTSSMLGPNNSRTSAGVNGISSVGTRFSGLNGSLDKDNSHNVGSMGMRKTKPFGAVVGGKSAENTAASSRMVVRPSSSRLFLPTASSLAKSVVNQSYPRIAGTPSSSSPGAKDAGRARNGADKRNEKALDSITNTRVVNNHGAVEEEEKDFSSIGAPFGLAKRSAPASVGSPPLKRALSGRKPRISRSKVIAKLASQRVVSASGSSISSRKSSGVVLKPRVSSSGSSASGRVSVCVKVARSSYGTGAKGVINAKRFGRQSEYARRRSSRVNLGLKEKENSMANA